MSRRFSSVSRTLCGVLALLLVFPALFFFAPSSSAATLKKTLAEALAWMDGKRGSKQDYDRSGSVQCVDLARMYSSFLGADLGVVNPKNPTIGVAADYIWQDIPAGYTRLTNSQTTVQAGDIFVNAKGKYGASSKTGHVGLVHHVSGNNYYIIDYGNERGAPSSYTKVVGLRSFSVVLRPKFKAGTFSLDVNGKLDGTVSGNLGDYGTFSITVKGEKKTGLKDYYNDTLKGSVAYTISDVKASPCHKYEGVASGKLSATITGNTKVVLAFSTAHTPEKVAAVKATCVSPGAAAGERCKVCGKVLSGLTAVPALGHSYTRARTPATCTADAFDTFTCARCGDSYTRAAKEEATYGAWSTTKPVPGENQTVETKTQYRYADRTAVWTKTASGTIDYAASWPSGFPTSSSLYTKYNVKPKTAKETATAKTEVSTSTVGWIYWHYCRNSYAYGPINRDISSNKNSTHTTFHGFYSTKDVAVTTSANARRLDNAAVCKDTYWWLVERVEIRRCAYTEYVKTSGDGWGEWSAWSDEKAAASDTRKVETREVYRLKTAEPVKATGHKWDGGTLSPAPTCVAAGEKLFTCAVCGAARKEAVPATGAHSFGVWTVKTPATAEKEGLEVRACTVCGKEETRTIPKLGPEEKVRLGDVDFNGSITAADARLALRRAVELEDYAPGSKSFIACDVDRSGGVTAADARLILRAAVELEDPKTWK